MEEPSVFLFKEENSGYKLYFGEYSTIHGLQLFDKNQKIKISKAGGTNLSNNEWITENDIEDITKVQQFIDYLNDNSQIDWTELELEIENFGTLRTHDDGECHLHSKYKKKMMTLVKKSINKRDSLPLEIALEQYQNNYLIYHKSGNIIKYQTFNDYLSSFK